MEGEGGKERRRVRKKDRQTETERGGDVEGQTEISKEGEREREKGE